MSLHQEIFEQPQILSTMFTDQRQKFQQLAEKLGKPRHIFIAARGSSDNAARYAKYVWGAFNQIPVTLATPSLFSLYQQPPDLTDMLVIGISQSGESPDLNAVLKGGNAQGCQTLTITNQSSSPLAEAADEVIDIGAGQEKSIAATKSYTGQLGVIACLSAAWNRDDEQWAQLENLTQVIEKSLDAENVLQRYAELFREVEHCIVLGRGFNYSTAYEWSLKLTELAYVFAQPYSSADFQHGPIAVVRDGFPVFAVAPQGKVFPDLAGLLSRLKSEYRARVLVISNDKNLLDLVDAPVSLDPQLPEWLSPLAAVIPAQLFSYYLTVAKGYDPDHPRGLTKVTKTY